MKDVEAVQKIKQSLPELLGFLGRGWMGCFLKEVEEGSLFGEFQNNNSSFRLLIGEASVAFCNAVAAGI